MNPESPWLSQVAQNGLHAPYQRILLSPPAVPRETQNLANAPRSLPGTRQIVFENPVKARCAWHNRWMLRPPPWSSSGCFIRILFKFVPALSEVNRNTLNWGSRPGTQGGTCFFVHNMRPPFAFRVHIYTYVCSSGTPKLGQDCYATWPSPRGRLTALSIQKLGLHVMAEPIAVRLFSREAGWLDWTERRNRPTTASCHLRGPQSIYQCPNVLLLSITILAGAARKGPVSNIYDDSRPLSSLSSPLRRV